EGHVFFACSMLADGGRCTCLFFCFQAEDGIRDRNVTGVQTCALPISPPRPRRPWTRRRRSHPWSRGSTRTARATLPQRDRAESGPPGTTRRSRAGGRTCQSAACRRRRCRQIGRASCRERVELAGAGGG